MLSQSFTQHLLILPPIFYKNFHLLINIYYIFLMSFYFYSFIKKFIIIILFVSIFKYSIKFNILNKKNKNRLK